MAVALKIIEEKNREKQLRLLKAETTEAENKVDLEFPYDDLAALYEYTMKELKIDNPF